jgi:hypothetical protein
MLAPVRNFRVRFCRYIIFGTDVIKVTVYDVAVFIHTYKIAPLIYLLFNQPRAPNLETAWYVR